MADMGRFLPFRADRVYGILRTYHLSKPILCSDPYGQRFGILPAVDVRPEIAELLVVALLINLGPPGLSERSSALWTFRFPRVAGFPVSFAICFGSAFGFFGRSVLFLGTGFSAILIDHSGTPCMGLSPS